VRPPTAGRLVIARKSYPATAPATIPHPTAEAVAGSEPPSGGLIVRTIVQLPEVLPAALMGLTLPGMVLLLANRFSPVTAWVLGLVGAALAVAALVLRPAAVRERATRSDAGWTVVAIAIVLGWVGLNSLWSGEDLFVTRDPATYGLAGRWLVDHQSLHIPVQADVFGGGSDLLGVSAGFGSAGHGMVYAQGNHGLSVLLAMTYRVDGPGLMLRTNLIIGGIGLLALYAVARRVVPAWLACAGVAALGFSMPMLYVGRDTYSEALAMAFLIGGIALFQRAMVSGRLVDYVITGLVVGSSAVARIDSYAALLGLIVTGAALTALAAPGARRTAVVRSGSMLVAAAIPTYLGLRDVQDLSIGYYSSQRSNLLSLGKAGVALLVIGIVVTAVAWAAPVRRLIESQRLQRVVGWSAGVAVIAAFAFFFSRPWWQTVRDPAAPEATTHFITVLQRSARVAIDPTRTYDEHTLFWIAWNHGWPLVVLGAAGYALLVWQLIARRNGRTLLLVAMGSAMTVLYLWRSNIVPDQTWAMRRYVPVVIPCLVVAALAAIAGVTALITRRGGRAGRLGGLAVAVTLAGSLIVVPAVITYPMYRVRTDVPLLSMVDRLCNALPANAAVVELESSAQSGYEQTMRSWCHVPSIGVAKPTPARLAAMRTAAEQHGYALYAFALNGSVVPVAQGTRLQAVYSVTATRWPNVIERVPQVRNVYYQTAFLGPVTPDGRVQTLPRA
jgi:hypothetical protein